MMIIITLFNYIILKILMMIIIITLKIFKKIDDDNYIKNI